MISIKDAVEETLNNHELSSEEAVDRHFGPTFRQRINGSWNDRAGFIARIDDLRTVVERATLTVLEELTDENRYAGRHTVDLLRRDGTRMRQEVFLFAERDPDGRFARIEETSLEFNEGEADQIRPDVQR